MNPQPRSSTDERQPRWPSASTRPEIFIGTGDAPRRKIRRGDPEQSAQWEETGKPRIIQGSAMPATERWLMAMNSAPENEKQRPGTLLSTTKTRWRDSLRQTSPGEAPAQEPTHMFNFHSKSRKVEIPVAGATNYDGNTWYCDCQPRQKAALRVVAGHGHNKGRSFWKCPQTGCSFFRWADEPAPATKPVAQLQTPEITPASRIFHGTASDDMAKLLLGGDYNSEKEATRKMTKTGCLTCRTRRIKCDEGRPSCLNCIKSKRNCGGYSQRVDLKESIPIRQAGPDIQEHEDRESMYKLLRYLRSRKESLSFAPGNTGGHDVDLSPDTSALSITDDALSTEDEDADPVADEKLAMLQRLMQHFHAVWAVCPVTSFGIRDQNIGARRSASASNNSQQAGLASSSNNSSSSRTTPPSSLKRSPKDEGDDGKGTKRPRGTTKDLPDETTSERFACPFFKKNPERHRGQQTCPGPGWLTVHRVKEHIYRRHSLPISCPRCHETFATDRLKDQHIGRAQRCELREQAPVEGMDATQEKLLRSRKKTHKCMSDAEKWHEMYLVLFPDTDPLNVPSPYYDYPASEGASASSESEMARYERFLRQQMPAQVRQELETRIEERLNPLEESLRREIVGIVADVQLRLFEMYRTMHAASGAANEAVETSRAPASPAVPDEAEVAAVLSGGYETVPDGTSAFDAPEYYETGDFDGMLFDFSAMDHQVEVGGCEPTMPYMNWDDLDFMPSIEGEQGAEESKGKGKDIEFQRFY